MKAVILNYSNASAIAGVMFACNLGRAALGFLSYGLIAYFFGLGSVTDSYFMALAIINMIATLLQNGPISKIYIPIFSRYISAGDKNGLEGFFSRLTTMNTLIFIPLSFLMFLAAPLLVSIIAPGFESEVKVRTILAVRYLSPLLIYMFLNEIFISLLQSMNRFYYPVFSGIISPLITSLFILLFHASLGINCVIIGTICGALLQLVALYYGTTRVGVRLHWAVSLNDKRFKEILKLISPFYAGNLATEGTNFIKRFLSSMLPAGCVSALSYAETLREYLISLFGEIIPTIVYPTLGRKGLSADRSELRQFIDKSIRMGNFVILPLLSILVILNGPIIKLAFQRGAFDSNDTYLVSLAFAIILLGLFPLVWSLIFQRTMFAIQKTFAINRIKIMNQLSVITVSLVLYKLYGFAGLVSIVALQTIANAVHYYFYLQKEISLKKMFFNTNSGRLLVSSAGAMLLCYVMTRSLLSGYMQLTWPWLAAKILFAGSIGIFSYLAFIYLFRAEELFILKDIFRNQPKRLMAVSNEIEPIYEK